MKILFAACILCVALAGCAGRSTDRTGSILKDITSLAAAEQIFGPATSKTPLDDGQVRAVWEFSQVFNAPARIEQREVFIGYDRDGFAVFRTVSVYVPPHEEFRDCRIDMVAGPNGALSHTASQGNSCDLLLTPQGRETAAKTRY